MKTLSDYRCDAIDEIELNGIVPHNMRVSVEHDRLVVFGSCLDPGCEVVLEKASCDDLNTGKIKIADMVRAIRAKIEASAVAVASSRP